MAEQHADPVTRPGLHVVTGGATGSAGSDETPAMAGAVVPMRVAERAGSAVRHWTATATQAARQLWPPFGRALYRLWHPEPETMAEHRAYARSMAWVPAELSGRKSGTVIAVAGIAYHVLIGHPVKFAMKAVQKAAANIDRDAERPLRMLMLAVFVSALALILLHL